MRLKASQKEASMIERVMLVTRTLFLTAMFFGGVPASSQVLLGSSTAAPVVSSAGAAASTAAAGSQVAPAVASASSSASAPAPAMTTQEGLALARAKACLGCHQIDSKRVGPAFTAIAQRRAEQEGAVLYLSHVIRKGGRGQWGAVPMPGQPVSEQDAQRLAQWITSLRK